jgi:hypothetical protein
LALSDRIPYQALIDRPTLVLTGGKRIAVWIILNVEEWRIEGAMPRTVLSPPPANCSLLISGALDAWP